MCASGPNPPGSFFALDFFIGKVAERVFTVGALGALLGP